jgi:hypothetical protein
MEVDEEVSGPGNGVDFTRSSRSPCHIRTACNRPEGDPRPTRWLELKVAWYREALDAPILSRLSRDMPKMLLRIAIVLSLLVSTARAKVVIRLAVPHPRMLYSWVKQYGASIEINGMASEILDTDDSLVTDRRQMKKRSKSPSNPSWITVFPSE